MNINKSLLTNFVALTIVIVSYCLSAPLSDYLFSIGLFALSGSVTNWLAIHMLFERVPFLYGSGIIPNKFEAFKLAIRSMLMEQFFTLENIQRFFAGSTSATKIDFGDIIQETDINPAFDALVHTIMESSFGSMLSMFGGASAIEPLREPFQNKMRTAIQTIANSDAFQQTLQQKMASGTASDRVLLHVDAIVQQRLEELTPQMVKSLIQNLIQQHLGWLVVWGGVFGGVFGLCSHLLQG